MSGVNYERGLMSKNRNTTFLNRRTGEVVPAGTDDVAGRIRRNRDGSYTAVTSTGHAQRVAKEEGAVAFLVDHYRS